MRRRNHLARLDAWLSKLRAERPLLFNLLALAAALLAFAAVFLLTKLL